MEASRDLPRHVLAILFIGALLALTLWILKPFLPATIWATTIVIATWPLLVKLQARLWNRRWLAVTVLIVFFLLVFILPFMLAITAIVANAGAISEWAKSLPTLQLGPLPDWIAKLPLVGDRIATAWRELAVLGGPGLAAQVKPYLSNLAWWFAASVGSLGTLFLQFLLTPVIMAILYTSGEAAAVGVRRFAVRLAGAQGEAAVRLAAQAIRAVALGVVLTAIVQAAAGGLGLLIARVPFAAILTAVMFMLSLAQLGSVFVLAPAVAWLYWTGHSGWGAFLLVWTLVVAPLDNFLRPMLIKRGAASLSMLLVFAGVVGGLVAFGLVGIFIGPVVLAVSSALLSAWIETGLALAREAPSQAGASGPGPAAGA
jgi:predicted PurR-regulated permease PerM